MRWDSLTNGKEQLTSSAKIHRVANCIVSVDTQSHQDVRGRVCDQYLK